ncbi:MAG: DNA-3-methyladenine glycosylase 2 family protein [Armatimonadetes bacterium]|nr:DNA-3-methyladenine glycosylase 2 family protein [Armatimonadota bacterium]
MNDPTARSIDISGALSALTSDPIIGPLIAQFGVIDRSPTEGPFHYLVHSIVSQQLSTKSARSIWERFLGLYGGDLPEPADLLRADAQVFRDAGFSWAKTRYVKDLARHFSEEGLSAMAFESMTDEQIRERLVQIDGIGPWTVDMFLMFGLGHPDVLPTGDLGIRKAVQAQFGLAAQPKPKEMEELAAAWRPWRTVACWYLWRSLA